MLYIERLYVLTCVSGYVVDVTRISCFSFIAESSWELTKRVFCILTAMPT